jgi:hypothetical protein
MTISMRQAIPDDAARIAEIHMAAFSSNAMLHAMFPTDDARLNLQKSMELKTVTEIKGSSSTVLVVQENHQELARSQGSHGTRPTKGEIISFAKWSLPTYIDDKQDPDPWVWPEGTNLEVVNAWGKKMEEVQARHVGSMPCYRKSKLCWPSWREKDAAQCCRPLESASSPVVLTNYRSELCWHSSVV